eukprot:scaffold277406_cov23-Tisochrysis_lutea.AAC.1
MSSCLYSTGAPAHAQVSKACVAFKTVPECRIEAVIPTEYCGICFGLVYVVQPQPWSRALAVCN